MESDHGQISWVGHEGAGSAGEDGEGGHLEETWVFAVVGGPVFGHESTEKTHFDRRVENLSDNTRSRRTRLGGGETGRSLTQYQCIT